MIDRSITRRLALGLAGLVVVAGCSGSGATSAPTSQGGAGGSPPTAVPASTAPSDAPSAAAGPAIEACDLLTEADIVELTTWKIATTDPHRVVGVFPEGCEWTLDGGTYAAVPASITLGVLMPGGRRLWDVSFAPFAGEEGKTPIEGVGDGALRGLAGSAMAVQGDALVDVQWIDGLGSDYDMTVAILERVLANLAP